MTDSSRQFIIGVDLGGTKIFAGAVSLDGKRTSGMRSIATQPEVGPDGVVDRIVTEPLGGAHRDPDLAIRNLNETIIEELKGCSALGGGELLRQRRAKYLAMT